ncbi:ester cyclase [Hyunsoonleella aestuarii]|uniref:SnoaL-like domain-containing protein n=1 Tax=Hyunsoonleella aestuarii TaxID=912802 RepID=A0ABP8EDU8_9FLAO|nr:ester cyclase [Hyunsoonleella aestuarii]
MKKLFVFWLATILFVACQNEPQRYFSESPEIESFKTSLEQYKNGEWDAWSAHFADTTKFHVNSNKGISLEEFKEGQHDITSNFSSYGFLDQGSFIEMVLDKDDETWVNYWATWQGTLKANDKKINIPVHITSRYIDGKVVDFYNYWDSAPLTTALAEIEKANGMPADEKDLNNKIDTFVNEFLNKQDSSVLDGLLADDYIRYMNDEKVASSPEELVTSMGVFFKGFPDFKITNPHRSSLAGNTIFVHWKMTGTNTGEFNGSAATGKEVKISGLSRLHFNGQGQLDEENVFFDQLSLMQQLGKTLN